MTDAMEIATDALADQVKQACKASGLNVMGFTFLVATDEGFHVSTQARVSYDLYMEALKEYIKDEEENPSPIR